MTVVCVLMTFCRPTEQDAPSRRQFPGTAGCLSKVAWCEERPQRFQKFADRSHSKREASRVPAAIHSAKTGPMNERRPCVHLPASSWAAPWPCPSLRVFFLVLWVQGLGVSLAGFQNRRGYTASTRDLMRKFGSQRPTTVLFRMFA